MFKLNYVENGDYKVSVHDKKYTTVPFVKLIALLNEKVSEEFDLLPELYELEEETAVGILYDNTCIDLEHFIDEHGALLFAVNQSSPITIQGEIDGLEEGKIEQKTDGDFVLFKKYNTTGKDFDILKSVYFKIYLPSMTQVSYLNTVLKKMAYHTDFIAMGREWDKNPCTENLYEDYGLLYYRYISLNNFEQEETYYSMINSLEIDQIMVLWEKYLEENVAYEEFERVYEMLIQEYDLNLFKWGIALNRVVRKKKINVKIESNNVYSIADQDGNKIRMGYNSISGAEKLFIKFLFPNK